MAEYERGLLRERAAAAREAAEARGLLRPTKRPHPSPGRDGTEDARGRLRRRGDRQDTRDQPRDDLSIHNPDVEVGSSWLVQTRNQVQAGAAFADGHPGE